MREREPRRVQELAPQPVAPRRAVLRVAGDRMADREQVRADLVRAAGLEPHAQQRVVRQRALDLEVRDRRARLVGVGRDPGAHAAVAANRGVDRAAPRRRPALDEREVLAHELAGRKLRLERGVHGLGPRDDQQPRRVAVEPVHDPGALGVLAARDAVRERLDERALRVAARRVHDHPCRLVDHEQVLVLPGDLERCLRHRRGRLGCVLLLHPHQLAPGEHVPLGPHGAVHGDVAAVDQPLRRRPRARVRSQEHVEPLAGRLRSGGQLTRHRPRRACAAGPRARRSA
jgi:hypothetical protein